MNQHPSDSGVQRTLGALEERTSSHDARLERIEEKIDHLVQAIDQAKGGWKVLVAAGAAAAAVTATAGKVLGWLGFHQ